MLLIFDNDHLKEYKDTRGHLAGNDLVSKIVAACHLKMRSLDLLSRLGGDEVVILARIFASNLVSNNGVI